jgi:23S rRNA (cytidine1920-2'-O)/16S rRNA (cytidine1409-2'-O)-methyltransferase
VRAAALASVTAFALSNLPGARLEGSIDSPIEGADGNREFLLCLRRT